MHNIVLYLRNIILHIIHNTNMIAIRLFVRDYNNNKFIFHVYLLTAIICQSILIVEFKRNLKGIMFCFELSCFYESIVMLRQYIKHRI